MANIVMTNVCNLKCPYCFANEFVNHNSDDISFENFREATEFILGDGKGHIGLIGGEPLLHHDFKKCLSFLLEDKRVRGIIIYTNAVAADKFLNELAADKVRLLINCNPPSDMGEASFKKMCENIEELIVNRHMKERITLGINMYKPDFEYEYILKLLLRYKFDHVRVSITVPNSEDSKKRSAIDDFTAIKPRMKEFFKAALQYGIQPRFDCNKFPVCLWNDADRTEFAKFYVGKRDELLEQMSNVECNPVIDITPDLTAIRCFGMSDCSKESIRDFRNIDELRHYYMNEFDSFKFNTVCDKKCIDCYNRKTMHCTGGCLSYKVTSMIKLSENARELMKTDAR